MRMMIVKNYIILQITVISRILKLKFIVKRILNIFIQLIRLVRIMRNLQSNS
jgi:hypothetical protein